MEWITPRGERSRPHLVALLSCAMIGGSLFADRVSAHDARPFSIDITEQGTGLYIARLRVPPTVEPDNQPTVIWPGNCRVLRDEPRNNPSAPSATMLVRCNGGLEGRHVSVRYPIYNPSLSTLFRLSEIGGKGVTQVLTPDQSDWQVPETPGWPQVAAGYLELGVQHIWKGIDHLLFVSGLLVLAGTRRRALLAITGFTLAHSITLSLSALDLVRVPAAPVEAAIALSILFLARQIARPSPEGLAGRFPLIVSSSFGLLHGFGFAAALREVGLPTKELALGLLCFNLGVEIGQILFIAGAIGLVLAIRRIAQFRGLTLIPSRGRLGLLAGYALGIPAAFWLIQRLGAF